MIVEGSTSLALLTIPATLIIACIYVILGVHSNLVTKKDNLVEEEHKEINRLIENICKKIEKHAKEDIDISNEKKAIEDHCKYIFKIEEDISSTLKNTKFSAYFFLISLLAGYGFYASISFPIELLSEVLLIVFISFLSLGVVSFASSLNGLVGFPPKK